MGHQALRDRIPSFDIRYSTFYGSSVRFSPQASGWAYFYAPPLYAG